MNLKLNVMMEYFSMHSIVSNEIKEKGKLSENFNNKYDELQINIDKVILSTDKAINSVKSMIINDNSSETLIRKKKTLRFYELESKFFKNIKACVIILKIIHSSLIVDFNKDFF